MIVTDDIVKKIKLVCREEEIPFLSDDMISFIVEESQTVNEAVYKCLIMKSEDTSLNVSGVNLPDSSAYFKRIARMYKPNNSGVLT